MKLLLIMIINLLQVGKKPEKITYVGIHNRRTDYLEFRRKRLKLDNLYEDYFEDAMEYFREEYWDTTVVFVYVSDDMKWGRRNLKDSKNLFFLGNLQQKIAEFCTLKPSYIYSWFLNPFFVLHSRPKIVSGSLFLTKKKLFTIFS